MCEKPKIELVSGPEDKVDGFTEKEEIKDS